MATSNRMLPIMAGVAAVITTGILVQKCSSDDALVKAGEPMQHLPRVTSGDADTMAETLATVTTSNNRLREDVQQLIEQNKQIAAENERLRSGRPQQYDAVVAPAAPGTPASPTANAAPSPLSTFSRAMDDATDTINQLSRKTRDVVVPDTRPLREAARGAPLPPGQELQEPAASSGAVAYRALAPMGWQAATETQRGKAPVVRYVRTSATAADQRAASAGQAVTRAQAAPPQADVPYFTLPDNSTLVDVTAMTAIIGRVPVDGRVTDPMQFKAIVGRHNLAANGWALPRDIEGVIVSGIAVGDMALSCSEGHIQSLTFIFNDGTVQTVASRTTSTSVNRNSSGTQRNAYLGYVSDLHGNPCIVGRFVTNAPSYLSDIVGLKAMEVAAQSFANAQTSTNQTSDGFSSAVTGSRGDYVLGQAASAATSEVSDWLLARLKNSFDAVVTPAGQRLVVHLTQEVRLDKTANARKIVHREQAVANHQRGGHYGLE